MQLTEYENGTPPLQKGSTIKFAFSECTVITVMAGFPIYTFPPPFYTLWECPNHTDMRYSFSVIF